MRRISIVLILTLILLPPVSAQLFSDNKVRLFPFVAEGKWGFIDKAGDIAIQAKYKSANRFSEGYAVVELMDETMTLIDADGNHAFEPLKFRLNKMSEGLSRAQFNGKWGYVNSKGETSIGFKFDEASDFFNGVARVQINRKFTFIDRRGNLLTKLYKLAYNFSEGLAIVEIAGKRGFIDLFDEIAIEPIYDDSDGFSQGLAAVRVGARYGYIDRSGIMAIEPKFENARWFSDGVAPIMLDGKWGFIDRDGKVKIQPTYLAVGNFYDGMASVKINGKWGFIDKSGKMVIEPRFLKAGTFSLGLASVEYCAPKSETDSEEICNLSYVTKKGEIIGNSSPNLLLAKKEPPQ